MGREKEDAEYSDAGSFRRVYREQDEAEQ